MEAIDILGRIDGFDHGLRVDPARQWQLHQDAVGCRVSVQRLDGRQQSGLRRLGRQPDGTSLNTGFPRGTILGSYIDTAGRIITDQNDSETGHKACSRNFGRHFGTQCRGYRFAVDKPCSHRDSSLASRREILPATWSTLSRLVWPKVTVMAEGGTSRALASMVQAARLARPSSAASLTPMRRHGPRDESDRP